MNSVIMMMIEVPILGFSTILATLLQGIRTKQFDDDHKLTALNNGGDALRDAIELEKRKKKALEKRK